MRSLCKAGSGKVLNRRDGFDRHCRLFARDFRHQNRAFSLQNHLFGNATSEPTRDSAGSLRPHDNEVALSLFSVRKDLVDGIPFDAPVFDVESLLDATRQSQSLKELSLEFLGREFGRIFDIADDRLIGDMQKDQRRVVLSSKITGDLVRLREGSLKDRGLRIV